jgi:hypothetical protein
MTYYEEIMEARFAANERFKKAVGQAIWFPDKVRTATGNEWVRRVAEIARKKPLPCTITPAEVELEDVG